MKTKIYFFFAVMMLATMSFAQRPQFSQVRTMPRVQRPMLMQDMPAARKASKIDTVNVGLAISYGTHLELGATSTVEYCVEGYVVNAESYNPLYGNQTWWMSSAKDNGIGQLFQAYRCTVMEDGVPMQVVNGDYIRLTGYLTYYDDVANNRKYTEIKFGIAEFVRKEEGDHSIPVVSKVNVATALSVGSSLSLGSYSEDTYEVVGYVSAVTETTNDYQSFWITDDPTSTASSNAGKAFYAYRNRPASPVSVGDMVSLKTRIYKYTNGVLETETSALVNPVSPIVAECNGLGWQDYNEDEGFNWDLWGTIGSNYVCIDVFSSNTYSPVGVYTFADGQFFEKYTGIRTDDAWISHAVDAWVCITEEKGILYVRATLIEDDGNIYAVSMSAASTISIDCGTNADIQYDPKEGFWFIEGADSNGYIPSFQYKSTNGSNPVGTYSYNLILDYTGLWGNNGFGGKAIDAEVTVSFSNNTYNVSGWFVWSGHKYVVTMTIPLYPVLVKVKTPQGTPSAGVTLLTYLFMEDDGSIPMTLNSEGYWTATLPAVQAYERFNFCATGNSDNCILQYGDEGWTNLSNQQFVYVWQDGTGSEKGYKVITLDYSDALYYKWTTPEQTKLKDYTVTIYAPTICDEVPALVGDFNNWNMENPAVMTPMVDKEYNTYYTYTFSDEPDHKFRIVAVPAQGGASSSENQLMRYDAQNKNWVECGNVALGDNTNIGGDFRDWDKYRFALCTEDAFPAKKVLVAIKLPEGLPAMGAEIIGTFNNWLEYSTDEPAYMEPYTQMEGVYYALVNAKANDCFLVRQANSRNNEVLMNGQMMECDDLVFGKLWHDAAAAALIDPQLVSKADKGIYLDWSNSNTYTWKIIPKTIYIDCGSNFVWTYYSKNNDWLIQALGYAGNDKYRVYVDAYAKDLASPVGEYSSDNSDFIMEKTRLVQPKDDTEIKLEKAEASIMLADGVISAAGTFIGEDNNIYVVTMAMEVPTPKEQETITATNLTYSDAPGYHTFSANDGNSTVEVHISPSVQNYAGTHAVGENMRVIIRKNNHTYNTVSGNISISEKEGKLELKGTVLGYNSVQYTLQLTNYEPPIGTTTLRVLIPTDNNMDTKDGVWIWWWLTNKDGHIVQTQPVGGNWYEATFEVDAPSFNFLVVNRNVLTHTNKWSGAQQTADYLNVTEAHSCYEMAYNNGNTKWDLFAAECTLQDHDYTYTVDFDNTYAGTLYIVVHADQLAPYYHLGYRPVGSTDNYHYVYWSTENGIATLYTTFENKEDAQYEIVFYGYTFSKEGAFYIATKITQETVSVKANPNVPEELKAVVNGANVTFSWEPKGTEAAYYIIEAYDESNELCFLSEPVYGSSVSTYIYSKGKYHWYLRTFDEDNYLLSDIEGENFTISTVPDLKPKNLNVSVSGKVATLTWEAPSPVDQTLLQIYQTDPSVSVVEEMISGENGKYSYSYIFEEGDKRDLQWMVTSYISDHTYFSSDHVYGDLFRAERKFYTLDVSADNGGSVNSNVNGTYEEGSKVTIVATPNTGYEFVKWSDQNENKTRLVTMDQNWTLIAMFKKIGGSEAAVETYTLHIASAGGGTVNEEVNKTYNSGEIVSITAKPMPDWTFDKWSDENTEPTRLIRMDKDYTLTAYFKTTKKFKVTITAGAGGKVTPDDINGKEYAGGEKLNVEAKANSGYVFSKWSDDNKEAKRTIFVDRDLTLEARFVEADKCTLRVEITPREEAGVVLFDDDVESSMYKVVQVGSIVTLTAKPASGYAFVRFEDEGYNINSREYDVTVRKTKTVTAVFQKEDEALESLPDNAASGTHKLMKDGAIYILRGDKMYTVQGQLIR